MVLTSRVLRISAAAIVAGVLIGVVGGLFQVLLVVAERWLVQLVAWAHGSPYIGWLAPMAVGAIGALLARYLVVRYAPEAEGSGVQRVEAVFAGEVRPAGLAVLPVKFIGGLLAIGSGLALGREGPTVQMGSSLALMTSRVLNRNDEDIRVLEAAGAGAGLAVAFNAPIAGSIFVFEELTLRFTPMLVVATFAAATIAVWVVRLMLGNHFDFMVAQLNLTPVYSLWPFCALGLLLGVLGALYNWVIVRLLRRLDRFSARTTVWRAGLIGASIGLVAWFAPALVGGGDSLTQAILSNHHTISALAIIFVLRFLIGPGSYAAGTPGGLFAPLLLLGASFGALFGGLLNLVHPNIGIPAVAFAVAGMATVFSAAVRAPITGIVLIVEMTGLGNITLGMLCASLVAVVVAMLLNTKPIYESLKERMKEQQAKREQAAAASAAASSASG